MYKKCFGCTGRLGVDQEVTLNDDVIEQVAKFLYLGYVLSCGEGVLKAVTARIKCGWNEYV